MLKRSLFALVMCALLDGRATAQRVSRIERLSDELWVRSRADEARVTKEYAER